MKMYILTNWIFNGYNDKGVLGQFYAELITFVFAHTQIAPLEI